MAGNIEKRGDNTWRVTVFLGTDPRTGKPQRHRKTIHGTKRQAQAYMNEVLVARDKGSFSDPSKLQVATYMEQWLTQAAKPRLHERTFQDYTGIVEKRINPAIGIITLDKLTPFTLQTFYNKLTASGLAPRTVRIVHVVLHSALKQAVVWRMIPFNPARDVELPRRVKREMSALDATQAQRFIDAAMADSQGVVYIVALTSGLRPGEYLALKWSDLDPNTGAIQVQRTVFWPKGGGWRFEECKTAKSRRTVFLPPDLLPILRHHRARQAEHRLRLGEAYAKHDLIFANLVGEPLDKCNLNKQHFKRILSAAGLPNMRPYDLRHSCATLLLAANKNPKVVAEMLGHASVVLTLDTYSHVLPSMQKDAADTLNQMLFPQAGG